MLKALKITTIALICATLGFFSRTVIRLNQIEWNGEESTVMPILPPNNMNIHPKDKFKAGNGIIFLETTDRMEPPSLVLCAIESAARVYPDRPVGFFMKGLHDIETEEDMNRTRNLFPSLSSFDNVHILPLRFKELFNNTPLQSWYEKVDPQKEVYWIHVLSDACRFAMIWTYGGIYMDTDIISMQPIPSDHFFAPQSTGAFSSGVFGLPRIHSLAWEFMDNFVQNYRGEVWGHQGPEVVSRVLRNKCKDVKISLQEDVTCGPLTFLFPDRFYPIPYMAWRKYYIQWQTPPTFNNSFGLHLWNFMNKEETIMVPGSDTLVEHLYRKSCPSVYRAERTKYDMVKKSKSTKQMEVTKGSDDESSVKA